MRKQLFCNACGKVFHKDDEVWSCYFPDGNGNCLFVECEKCSYSENKRLGEKND